MIIRIIFGFLSALIAGVAWNFVTYISGGEGGNSDEQSALLASAGVMLLIVTLAIWTPQLRKAWGFGVAATALATLYLPLAIMLTGFKTTADAAGVDQDPLGRAATLIGGGIGTTITTLFASVIGGFLGVILLLVSYFLLRDTFSEKLALSKGQIVPLTPEILASRTGQVLKWLLITAAVLVFLVGLLSSGFSTMSSSDSTIPEPDAAGQAGNAQLDAPSPPTSASDGVWVPTPAPAAPEAVTDAEAASPPTQEFSSPSMGSPERIAILDAIRPQAESQLGGAVKFVVKTIRVTGDYAYVEVMPQRPNGQPYMIQGPALTAARADALLERRNGKWFPIEFRLGATDTWYLNYCYHVPNGLLDGC